MLKAHTIKGTKWVMVGETANLANQTGEGQFLQLLEEDMDAEFLSSPPATRPSNQ